MRKDYYDQTNQYLEQCPYYYPHNNPLSNTNFYQQPPISETEHSFEKNIAVHSMVEYDDNVVSSTTKEIGFDNFDSNTTKNVSWNLPTTMSTKVAIFESSTLTKSEKASEKYVHTILLYYFNNIISMKSYIKFRRGNTFSNPVQFPVLCA